MRKFITLAALVLALGGGAAACDDNNTTSGDAGDKSGDEDKGSSGTAADGRSLTIYSGREEELVADIFEQFEEESGITLNVRYGDSAELAAQILEEGDNSPADVYFAQDAGSLGAVEAAGAFASLPDDILNLVPARFRSTSGGWIGTSGRARVAVFNTEALTEADMPASILDFTDPAWKGKVGWAPTNGSFQSFVTALRKVEGEDGAREWLEAMKANDAQVYDGNSAIVQAVIDGEIEVGFVNHYYLLRFLAEDPATPAANHFFAGGDPGSLVNTAGVGIVKASGEPEAAETFVRFLLSETAQTYFAGHTEEDGFEYPLTEGLESPESLPALTEIEQPDVDLGDLRDLEGTLALLQEVGLV
ncbi:MAG TPA: iron ABC transporter substrate-binding protein [Acidimicrobiia bacterium]|nr:iron ABC transporter substrate-binding protein [Acidimicrobiia bacterium]